MDVLYLLVFDEAGIIDCLRKKEAVLKQFHRLSIAPGNDLVKQTPRDGPTASLYIFPQQQRREKKRAVNVILEYLYLGLAKRSLLPLQGKNFDLETGPVQLNEISHGRILVPDRKPTKDHC
jgi:hypothetical protein